MKKIQELTGNYIYLPCTPAKWITQPTHKKITRINLTAGGGIGGSTWTEYVEQTNNIQTNTIQEFTRITGKKIKLNTNYITDAEDFNLITVQFHNENPNTYKIGNNTLQYIAEDEYKEPKLLNSYGETPTR